MDERPAPEIDVDDCKGRLKRAQRALGSLYHDLNNPLSIISGNIHLLLEMSNSENLGEDVVESLHDIERATSQMTHLVTKLVDLKKSLEG